MINETLIFLRRARAAFARRRQQNVRRRRKIKKPYLIKGFKVFELTLIRTLISVLYIVNWRVAYFLCRSTETYFGCRQTSVILPPERAVFNFKTIGSSRPDILINDGHFVCDVFAKRIVRFSHSSCLYRWFQK